jgi:hypothetical protein
MHRSGPSWFLLLVAISLFHAGCGTAPAPEASFVRSIFVQEPIGAVTAEMRLCGEVAHDAAVRRLEALGYRAAKDEAEADAILEGTWGLSPATADASRQQVTLRLVLREQSGRTLFAVEVIKGVPLGFLSKDRVGEQVGEELSALVRARSVR